jgi:hypothetical protein
MVPSEVLISAVAARVEQRNNNPGARVGYIDAIRLMQVAPGTGKGKIVRC